MATLERIRKKAGLLVTIVGVALFAFIIGDLLNSGNSFLRKNQNVIISVDGEDIDYPDYIKREKDLEEIYKLQTGTQNLPEEYRSQMRQTLYEEIIMENILGKRLDNLGITVTREEMTDMTEGENISPLLRQVPMFQNPQTGAFDRNAILMFLNRIKDIDRYPPEAQEQLSQYRMMWFFWEKNIKMNRLSEKYMTLLTKAIVPNSLDAKDAFNNSAENSDIVYVMASFGNAAADSSIQVSKSEIEKLYNERKPMYKQPKNAIIDYIAVDVVPSREDYGKMEEDMNEIRKELESTDNVAALTNEKSEKKYADVYRSLADFRSESDMMDNDISDFLATAETGAIEGPLFRDDKYRIFKLVDKTVGPDSVKVQIISVAPQEKQENTKNFADSLIKVLNGGADFAEIAGKYSTDRVAQEGGELGWVTEIGAQRMQLNEEFRKTAFSIPVGQIALVKAGIGSNSGYHIIKISEKTANVPKYKVAVIENTVTPSSLTRTTAFNALSQFVAKNNSIEKIEASAQENGFDLVKNAQIFTTDHQIGSVFGARQVVQWVFNAKKGQISDILECTSTNRFGTNSSQFVVAASKGVFPEGYQSLASVTPQIKSYLAAKKKGEEIAADLKARNITSIDAYANAMGGTPDTVRFITMGTSRITNIGYEPKLNALVTYSPLNQVSEPVIGENGVYVFQVINRTENPSAFDDKRERSMLQMNSQYRIGSMALRTLEDNVKIVDNRVRFF